jgi:glycosyltransferase involved in cell wall biosynthesis
VALSISTIIPTHNRAHLVGRAVESALAASRAETGDEVIVVDDGSTDDTGRVLDAFGGRIRYLPVPHGGAGAARNQGLRAARNPLVAFLDSDDEWQADKLDLQRPLMEARPDVVFCFSDFAVRDRAGRHRPRYLPNWHRDPRGWDEILGPSVPFSSLAPLPAGREDFGVFVGDLFLAEMLRDYVSTITLVARREAAGPAWFAEDVPVYEDWECFARLAQAGRAAYLDCETALNHGHREHRLTDADDLATSGARIRILERVWGRDAAFQARHGDDYRRRLEEQRRVRSRQLLKQGRIEEAREELSRLASASSWQERMIGRCPAPVLRGLASAYRLLGRG